jgi:hypothetical protein
MSKREHHPLCDSRLGPYFEVRPGEVVMSLHFCWAFECWDEAGRRMADDAEAFANRP